jgi:Big-like domain-containing protein/polysaccharide lyase-like protein
MHAAHQAGRPALLRLAIAALLALAASLVIAAPAGASVSSLLASFGTGSFSEFNDGANTSNATLTLLGDRGYDDSHSALAVYPGGGVNAYARVIQDVAWSAGDDVWYGAAYYLPSGFKTAMQQEVALQRWDNYSTYGSDGDIGGIVIWNSDKLARLKICKYSSSTETLLTPGFSLPEGRWFWLEVHQRFSSSSGSALNEVYLNGTRVASSTTANFNRPIEKLRTGLVAQGGIAQTNPLTVGFDRVSIATHQVGPVGGTTSDPAPAPAPKAPVVQIASPADGTTFGSSLSMSATVVDPAPIAKVDFLIDGKLVATRTASPWSYTYDASGLSSGWHTVTIKATDANGLSGQASVRVRHELNQRGAKIATATPTSTRIRMNVAVSRHRIARHRHKRPHRHRHGARRRHHRRHVHARARHHHHHRHARA